MRVPLLFAIDRYPTHSTRVGADRSRWYSSRGADPAKRAHAAEGRERSSLVTERGNMSVLIVRTMINIMNNNNNSVVPVWRLADSASFTLASKRLSVLLT